MSIQPFSKDVAVIQKLDDEPNDVTGLTPAELKLRFDQAAIWLKDYINNTLIPALSGASSGGATGASNIGASVPNFSGSTVQAILNAFNDALVDRYTKAQTNSYVGQETNDLVASVTLNSATGVITVTKKDGSKQTYDTPLEKVPASMALVEESGSTYLVITNQDGSKTKTDVSKLIDQYVFNDSAELDFSTQTSGGVVAVTASIRPSSIGLDRFKPQVTEKLEEYNATSKKYADDAMQSASTSNTYSNFASEAALRAENSLSQAKNSASDAAGSAAQAAQSATAAAASSSAAQSSAAQALESKNAAQSAQAEAERWAKEAENAAGGKSPYQYALEYGYTGTEAEFYAALVGLKDGPFLPIKGGTMSGSVDMGGNSITNLNVIGGGESGLIEIASKINLTSGLISDGGVGINFGGDRIQGVNTPQLPTDAANKIYVDNLFAQAGSSGPVIIPATIEFKLADSEGTVDPDGDRRILLLYDGMSFLLNGDVTFSFASTVRLESFSITIAPDTGYEFGPTNSSYSLWTVMQNFYALSGYAVILKHSFSVASSYIGPSRTYSLLSNKPSVNGITLCAGVISGGKKVDA